MTTGNLSIRVPNEVPINGVIPIEWQRYFSDVASPLSPSGTGTIYTSADGGQTTVLESFASLLLTGMVRNVVVGTTSTPVTNATSTYAATTLSATITPSLASSSILVLVCQNGCSKDTGDTAIGLRIVRGLTTLSQLASDAARTGAVGTNDIGTIAGGVLDAPNTNTVITYSTQFISASNIANANVQSGPAASIMVLIEVLA